MKKKKSCESLDIFLTCRVVPLQIPEVHKRSKNAKTQSVVHGSSTIQLKWRVQKLSELFHLLKFSSTINFTCAKVMEIFSFFFLAAKIREDTSSEAFEHSGVTTNDT